jgi:hypothetical protein
MSWLKQKSGLRHMHIDQDHRELMAVSDSQLYDYASSLPVDSVEEDDARAGEPTGEHIGDL